MVYALINSGSEETLITKKLFRDLKLCGIPLQVLLVTADGARSLVLTSNTSFKIGPFDNPNLSFDISEALVMKNLPSIDKNYPIASSIYPFI